MKQHTKWLFPVLIVAAATATFADSPDADHFWPQWRGPLGTGVAPHADPPIHWDEKTNIRWKIKLPGKGHSSPVVWHDRVFVTAAVPFGEAVPPRLSGAPGAHDEVPVTNTHEFMVMAIRRRDGKILWKRTVRQQIPHAGGHYTASLASSSPVTDGDRLFAFFNSYGLYCLDLQGELLWEKDLGRMHPLHSHGEGSSPALYRDTLIINWDHQGPSFVVAFDVATGNRRWKVERDDVSSWTTPIIVEHAGKPQVIVSGSQLVQSYDLTTGRVIWKCAGLSVKNVVSSPVAAGNMVFTGSSYDRPAMLAIRLDGAAGDITGSDHLVWTRKRGAPYVPSPLLYDGSLYFIAHFQPVLTRVDAITGRDQPGAFRLNGLRHVFASPVAAANRLYITDRDGTTLVLSHDNKPQTLASNRLDDSFSATPALAGREIYLRGEQYLYCIARE